MRNSHPLEVVGCGGEMQLQMAENLNKIDKEKGLNTIIVMINY